MFKLKLSRRFLGRGLSPVPGSQSDSAEQGVVVQLARVPFVFSSQHIQTSLCVSHIFESEEPRCSPVCLWCLDPSSLDHWDTRVHDFAKFVTGTRPTVCAALWTEQLRGSSPTLDSPWFQTAPSRNVRILSEKQERERVLLRILVQDGETHTFLSSAW